MKTLLLALLALPTFASAQSFVTKEIKGKTYAMPIVNFFELRTEGRSLSCGQTNFLLKEAMESYKKYNCNKPSEMNCSAYVDAIIAWNKVSDPLNGDKSLRTHTLVIDQLDEKKALDGIVREFNLDPKDVKVFLPDYQKIKIDLSYEVVDEDNIYLQAMKMAGLPLKIGIANDGKSVFTSGKLSECALKDKAIIIDGEYDQTETVKVPVSNAIVADVQKYYDDVAVTWKKEEKRDWKNNLHKILSIGVILKEKAQGKNLEKIMDMNKAFDKFFNTYTNADGDEGVSVYLNEFRTTEEFRNKVLPAYEESLTYRAYLKQK